MSVPCRNVTRVGWQRGFKVCAKGLRVYQTRLTPCQGRMKPWPCSAGLGFLHASIYALANVVLHLAPWCFVSCVAAARATHEACTAPAPSLLTGVRLTPLMLPGSSVPAPLLPAPLLPAPQMLMVPLHTRPAGPLCSRDPFWDGW